MRVLFERLSHAKIGGKGGELVPCAIETVVRDSAFLTLPHRLNGTKKAAGFTVHSEPGEGCGHAPVFRISHCSVLPKSNRV